MFRHNKYERLIDVFNFCQLIILNTWNWDYEEGNQAIDEDDESDSLISALPSSTKSVLPSLHIADSKRNWIIYVGYAAITLIFNLVVVVLFAFICMWFWLCSYSCSCSCSRLLLCCVQCLIIMENFRFLVLRSSRASRARARWRSKSGYERLFLLFSQASMKIIAWLSHDDNLRQQSAYICSDQRKSSKYQ